jgi:putative nucleotidyltransferase with HDIG domain
MAAVGLRVRVLLVVLAATIPALGLLGYAHVEARRAATASVQQSALGLARLAAQEHSRLVEGTRYLLIALASGVRDHGPAACQTFFANLRRELEAYANVGVAEPGGHVACSGVPLPGAVNIADRLYFQRAVWTRGFAIGEYQIGRITGKPSLNFGYPVLDGRGRLVAVVFAALDLSWLNDAASRAPLPQGSTVTVVDEQGLILARYPDPQRWVGRSALQASIVNTALMRREGVATDVGLDGVRRIYGFSPITEGAQAGLVAILVGIPETDALADVNRAAAQHLAGLGLVVLILLVAAAVGVDTVVLRPVGALLTTAQKVREGDLTARTGAAAYDGELGQLMRAFDEMTEALQHREARLEETSTQLREALADARRRLSRLQALRVIDLAILGAFDLSRALGILLHEVTRQLQVDAADVLLLRQDGETLECVASRGFHAPVRLRARTRIGEGIAGRAIATRAPVRFPDPAHTGPGQVSLPEGEDFVACVATPLVTQDTVLGVLELFHRQPLDPDPEWMQFVDALAGQAAIAIQSAQLFERLRQAHEDLQQAYDATLEGWSRALDLRDQATENHTLRVTALTVQLARRLGVPEQDLVHIRRGALLHDIGKMGIPDEILRKQGGLTREEWDVMRKHPIYAYELLWPIPYLRPALDIPYAHHEKWDGTGYPRGLRGEQIPLAARIFAVVDVWDALRTDRPYRAGWSDALARQHLRAEAGRHFDPAVVEAFLQMLEEMDRARPEPLRSTRQ